MNSVQRTAVFLLGVMFVASQCIRRVEACWQESPSVTLRAQTIAGTVTLNGKPVQGAMFRLHKLLGPYSIEPAHADPHVLGEAVSEKDGSFNFGGVPSGKYALFVGQPSGMSIEVDLVKPKSGESDTVAIDNFADSCISAKVFSADGRRLATRSNATIHGRLPD